MKQNSIKLYEGQLGQMVCLVTPPFDWAHEVCTPAVQVLVGRLVFLSLDKTCTCPSMLLVQLNKLVMYATSEVDIDES